MNKMKKVRLLAVVIAAACLWILLLQLGIRLYKNHQIINDFSYNAYQQQYQRAIPVEEMDFNEYRRYFTKNETAVKLAVNNTASLPGNVRYYIRQDGEMVLSYEIPKGTTVTWTASNTSYSMDAGYGLCSYPTYERGWRYARPFTTVNQNTGAESSSYYFVRTEDLERTAQTIIGDNESLQKSMQSRGLSTGDAVIAMTRYVDNIFYDHGVFCSPDLQQPVWRWTDVIWLSLSVAALAAVVCSFRKQKRHALLISRRNEIMDTGTKR